MGRFKNAFFFILVLALVPKNTFGQATNKAEMYSWFDSKIGKTNSGIYNGLEYIEEYRMLNEQHKFFLNPNFSNGWVIFNGEPFYNLQLKYDVFEDQLLLRYLDKPNTPTIILEKEKISKFSIGNHHFDMLQFITQKGNKVSGFFELLLHNQSLKLYKKNHKKIRTKNNDRIKYYEFKEQNSYVVVFNGDYYQLNRLNHLSLIFSDYKSQLKPIESNYKSLKKSNPDEYIKSVLEAFNNKFLRTP